jgi:prepilin-type N-terminal cleavage/methylation domain-containing protein
MQNQLLTRVVCGSKPAPYSQRMRAQANGRSFPVGSRGFSLIETLIVVTIALTVSAMAIPKFTQVWYGAQLRSATAGVASTMQQARMAAARSNSTYPVRYRINGGLQEVYIDYNNNSAWDSGEPLTTMPKSIVAASGAPTGASGQPTAYTLAWDTTSGTPFSNTNTLAYSPRGLPCNYVSGTCATPAASYFVYYFQDIRAGGWSAVLVTKSGRSKTMIWNGGSWN